MILRLLLTVAVTGALLAPAASAQDLTPEAPATTDPEPTLVIEPSTDLVSNTRAMASGSGFPANANLLISQCLPAAEVLDDCDTRFGFPSSDSTGAFSTTISIYAVINPANSVGFDCSASAEPCIVVAVDVNEGRRARVPVSFDPDGVLPPLGTISIEPSTGLIDRQTVQLSLMLDGPTEFGLSVRQCRAEGLCDEPQVGFFHGDESATVQVRRLLSDGFDCASAEGACVLEVLDSFTSQSAETPLSFDPEAEVVPLLLTAEPSTDLPFIATTEVTGSNWTPNEGLTINQCAAGASPNFDNSCIRRAFVFSEDGTFAQTVTLRRTIRTGPDETLDCAVAPGCELVAQGNHDPRDLARFAIGFDPTTEPPPPGTFTVEPSTDLPFRAELTVVGTNLGDEQQFGEIYLCPAAALPTAEAGAPFDVCRFLDSTNGDLGGSFEATVRVARQFQVFGNQVTSVDCVTEECVVVFISYGRFETEVFSTAISFDPDSPIPPPPTLEVSPASGLGDLDEVTVTGSGFEPFSFVSLDQCVNGACFGNETAASTDASGNLSTTFRVRRVVETYGGPADCATDFDCALAVQVRTDFGENTRIDTALDFDPALPVVPREITVSPSTGLRDGQDLTITASGVSPNRFLSITQCVAGTRNCAFYSARTNDPDSDGGDGSFTITIPAQRDFYGELDAIDCVEVGCELTVSTNSFLGRDETTIPLSYDDSLPFEPATFEVTPNSNLIDGQRVETFAERWPLDGCCGGDGGGHFGEVPAIAVASGGAEAEATAAEVAVEAPAFEELSIADEFDFNGGEISFGQCAVVDGQRAECFYGHTEPVEEDGSFASRAFARRFIGDFDCLEVECRLLIEAFSSRTSQRFVASQIMTYDPNGLEVIPGLAFVDEGSTQLPTELPVKLSRPVESDISVDWELVGFGAEPGGDFAAASGTLTIPAGATEASIPIQVYDDGAGENNEAVLVAFSDPNLGRLGGFGFGGLVIVDNDGGPST